MRSVSARRIGAGQGFTTQVARLTVEYDDAEADGPQTLIAKLPAADEGIRARMVRNRFYEREVLFYENLAKSMPLRVPECYFSTRDAETGNFALLLEDMNVAGFSRRLNFGAGTLDEVGLALREIATLHATWWEDDTRLDDLGWVPGFDEGVEAVQEQFQRSWPVFLRAVGDMVPPQARVIGDALGGHIPHVARELSQSPRTLLHGDFRFDNILAGKGNGGTLLAIIDWQLVRRGRGVYDVAFFLPGILEPGSQATVGIDLLRGYHATLEECGVRGYGFDACLRDYRLALLEVLTFVVRASAMLDFSSRRGRLMLTRLAEQLSAALIDLEAAALLPG